jgi:GDPmannose 4,6-dehydratase
MKKALITGVTGQDGSYLVELLLRKGYEVHGVKRRSSSFNTERLNQVYSDVHDHESRFHLHFGDLADMASLWSIIQLVEPDEIYNLAAQSHVRVSFEVPEYTTDITATGALRMLEVVRRSGIQTRFYQASSSEMFGRVPPPQSEISGFHPRSPYACSKLFAHNITVNYRESYGIFACSGILFNHESPRRGETFVTRKIARAVAQIKFGLERKVYLGNLDARRDWGYAPEYVEAMWRMLQQDEPRDYVIGTGEMHSVREFVEIAFAHADMDWREFVEVDPRYLRPAEVEALQADATFARKELGWTHRMGFEQLVRLMVDAEVEALVRRSEGTLVAESGRVD